MEKIEGMEGNGSTWTEIKETWKERNWARDNTNKYQQIPSNTNTAKYKQIPTSMTT